MKKKQSPGKARPSRQKAEEIIVPVAAVAEESNLSRLKVVGALALAALAVWFLMKPKAPSGGAPAAAPVQAASAVPAEWGAEVELERVAKFGVEAKEAFMDLEVDASGAVYALAGSEVQLYKEGKLVKAVTAGGGPNRSMAFDGKNLLLTNSDGAFLSRLGADLSDKGSFKVENGSRLLGIAWVPEKRQFAVAEVGGHSVHFIDAAGKKSRTESGPLPKEALDGFAYDLAVDEKGALWENDVYSGIVSTLAPEKTRKVFKYPCPSRYNSRIAILAGLMYLQCPANGAIVIRDLQGRGAGYFKVGQVQTLTAGADGFLYVLSEGKVHQFKPLAAETAKANIAALEAAAKPASPTAKAAEPAAKAQ